MRQLFYLTSLINFQAFVSIEKVDIMNRIAQLLFNPSKNFITLIVKKKTVSLILSLNISMEVVIKESQWPTTELKSLKIKTKLTK